MWIGVAPRTRVWVVVLGAAVLCWAPRGSAWGQVRVVTTTPALADITKQIGGEHVEVESIAQGPENVHNIAPKPSYLMKARRADLFVHSGLDGEPWVPQLLKTARKPELLPGGDANVNASRGVPLKEVPQRGALTRAEGDIHVYGNTHYLLDPMNGIIVTGTIAEALKAKDPEHGPEYERNREALETRLRELTDRLAARLAPYGGAKVVTYHRSWPYFLDRFGLEKVAEVEPKPGIAPGPQHVRQVVETMQRLNALVVIVESFNPRKNAEAVAERAGGRAVVLAHDVKAVPEVDTYERLFEYNVEALVAAFEAIGVRPAAGPRAALGE